MDIVIQLLTSNACLHKHDTCMHGLAAWLIRTYIDTIECTAVYVQ